jgi:hypothetical protein
MDTLKWFVVVGLLGLSLAGEALAQQSPTTAIRQPASIEQAAFAADGNVTFTAQPDAGPAAAPSGGAPGVAEAQAPAKEEKKEEEKPEEPKAWQLFGPWLECHPKIDIRGWMDMGFTWNPDSPINRFNGEVGYNDRANEFQFNQVYLIIEKVTKTDECNCIDTGFRADLLYGTDRRYPAATGWDDEWNLGHRFYGLIMPQLYGDVAVNNLILRTGHILAPCGNESVMAPENFFYSHSYSFLYGQPTTLTGESAIYKVNDKFSFNAGLDSGWNNWINPGDRVNYMGGFNWTSCDEKRTLAAEVFVGDQLVGVDSTRSLLNIVFTQKLGPKWVYALETNFAYDQALIAVPGIAGPGSRKHADWNGVANYLTYTINDCWSWGIRYEYFNDDDGAVVQQVGPPSAGPVPSDYSAATMGLNYKPNKNVVVRTELRYDHSTAPVFENFTTKDQFLWGTDLIVRF